MPHVLWEQQGLQRAIYRTEANGGRGNATIMRLELAERGRLTENEYKRLARDLVGFLVYVGEPAKLVRHRIGFWVIAFLMILLVAAYLMKREYWKDVY